ncbi:PIG-L family deacetylase [Edaphobacter sp.]|uniref:PIG-L family deacetylase n=1 Tax=Edaphobacter sp. TaxID=1934404 RepID=UPI002DB96D2B|nr:PIG-L family deacetylase [Edaphobacter sp.]HEU5342447.1 PIG-L family deacetylase [Edaphobacter sp.]
MATMRKLGRFWVGGLALAVVTASGQNRTPAERDPANLAGEQIRPAVTVRRVAANEGAVALWQSLQKLRTRASLMMVVAHPDDEDGGMLTYEVRGQGAHVAMLTLTRGEGGQNLMSGDFDGALGLVRTQELLAADRYMGVDQMWGSVVDFGFSKTKEESLKNWGHERVLYDAVRAVRLYRPLVVTSVFEGGVTDGHGQHQVSGEMAQEVFNAAGDPSVFPDQIAAGLMPWNPLKVYARAPLFRVSSKGMFDYATGRWAPARFYNYVTKEWSNESPKPNVVIHEGDYSPVLGMSYLQFARLGLGLQKTQNGGMGVPAAGEFDSAYHRYGSRVQTGDEEKSFFDGIDTSLTGIATLAPDEKSFLRQDLEKIDGLVEQAVATYSIAAPEKTAPFLRDGLKATDALIAKVESSGISAQEKYNVLHELRVKHVQFNDALVEALGLSLRAQVTSGTDGGGPFARFGDGGDTFVTAIPGQTFGVRVHVANGSGEKVVLKSVALDSPIGAQTQQSDAAGNTDTALTANAARDVRFTVKLPEHAGVTRPPFTRPNDEQNYYDIANPAMRNASLALPPLTAWATVNYDGVDIKLGEEVQTLHRVTGQGTVYEPLVVAPAISVSVSPAAGVVPLTEKTLTVTAHVRSNVKGVARGTVRLELPSGWSANPATAEFSLPKDGDAVDVPFVVTPSKMTETAYTMTAVATYAGEEYREGYKTVGYAGLLPANLYRPATYRARGVDVTVATAPGRRALRVGYLPGTGDEVQASLENIGVYATTLSMSDITAGRLSHFDVIVLGVRAYAAHPDLAAANAQLLAYAKAGGVVIVQYNSSQFDHNFGPYPLTLGGNGERVVDETAPVKLLQPDSPALTWPNRITERDFDNWYEERGHGFIESWDPHYDALLETHDPGQDPQKGGLLVARTGKGVYVYMAYALYRELPEGVPGAYRLFANLLSLGRAPARGTTIPTAK